MHVFPDQAVQFTPPPLLLWELLETTPCELLEEELLDEELLDEEELEELDDGWVCEE